MSAALVKQQNGAPNQEKTVQTEHLDIAIFDNVFAGYTQRLAKEMIGNEPILPDPFTLDEEEEFNAQALTNDTQAIFERFWHESSYVMEAIALELGLGYLEPKDGFITLPEVLNTFPMDAVKTIIAYFTKKGRNGIILSADWANELLANTSEECIRLHSSLLHGYFKFIEDRRFEGVCLLPPDVLSHSALVLMEYCQALPTSIEQKLDISDEILFEIAILPSLYYAGRVKDAQKILSILYPNESIDVENFMLNLRPEPDYKRPGVEYSNPVHLTDQQLAKHISNQSKLDEGVYQTRFASFLKWLQKYKNETPSEPVNWNAFAKKPEDEARIKQVFSSMVSKMGEALGDIINWHIAKWEDENLIPESLLYDPEFNPVNYAHVVLETFLQGTSSVGINIHILEPHSSIIHMAVTNVLSKRNRDAINEYETLERKAASKRPIRIALFGAGGSLAKAELTNEVPDKPGDLTRNKILQNISTLMVLRRNIIRKGGGVSDSDKVIFMGLIYCGEKVKAQILLDTMGTTENIDNYMATLRTKNFNGRVNTKYSAPELKDI